MTASYTRNDADQLRRRFTDEHLLQIAMPMGGIGAGSINLNGYGGVQDFSIHHQPSFTAVPDGHRHGIGGFATLHTKATSLCTENTRLVEGPLPRPKIYDQGLQGQGYRNVGFAGLPRFANAAFEASYPTGRVELSDPALPLAVSITGWSPFVPLDDHHSSMPCAVLEYELSNSGREPVEYAFCYHLENLAAKPNPRQSRNRVIPERGVMMDNLQPATDPAFGSCSVTCVGHEPTSIKAMWMRGWWFDWLMALWREVSAGTLVPNDGLAHDSPDQTGINGGSIELAGTLEPGQSVTYPIVLTWYFPNADIFVGQPKSDCDPSTGCCDGEAKPKVWHPYYAAHWSDAEAVATTVHDKFASLREKTFAFRDALAESTLPDAAVDAIASNLAILKSPTVLRQDNGNVWGWEGCFADHGCCHGTCTHVWNYAQSMPHLFPMLERTLREQELERSMDEQGHVTFRAALPDGPTTHGHHPAADGQLGGIMKVFRDWRISGDDAWLRKMYPKLKRSLDYCINRWDPDGRGALFEPHHNTYDIEFWGPDGMCCTVYVGALSAAATMADHLEEASDAARYRGLAELGGTYLSEHLFNGDYYQQRVAWEDAKDSSFADYLAKDPSAEPERHAMLTREGPPYQYGPGCLSDGVIGAWMADLYQVDHPMNTGELESSLDAIYTHNFKPDLWDHACTQRAGYALGHEPGLVTCSWPRGDRATIPFPYCDEVFTGIEYQVASHLMLHGRVTEGLTITEGARSRYDGYTRNPFNEYECGNYYARAMSSYALLEALSGFAYNAVTRQLTFGPRVNQRPFRCFFAAASGYGTIGLTESALTVSVLDGELSIGTLIFNAQGQQRDFTVQSTATPIAPVTIDLT